MSRSLFAPLASSVLRSSRELSISPLDTKHLLQFAMRAQKTPLNEMQKEQLLSAFTNNKSLNELAVMLNEFLELKYNFAARAGLSNKQFEHLRVLIEEKKHLREAHEKDKYNMGINKSIMANAKASLPFEHILEWWTNASNRLNTTECWENFLKACTHESKYNKEPENTLKNRWRDINYIKSEWETYSAFAGYSSENLLEFYSHYLAVMEATLINHLNNKHKLPALIHSYLETILGQLQDLKKQMIYSMLYRMRCAEYYNDAKCDDLLAYTCDRIEQKTNIHLNKTGKIPNRRRTLDANCLARFDRIIQDYCQANPNEMSIKAMFMQLRIKNVPLNWSSKGLHPLLVYFANTYPMQLEKAYDISSLVKELLHTDCTQDKLFLLNNLRNNLKYALSLYEINADSANNPMSIFLKQQQKKYRTLLKEINKKIIIEIESAMNLILDCTFEAGNVNDEQMNSAIKMLERAANFNKKYTDDEYFLPGDIILALATKLKEMIKQQKEITPLHCQSMLKLIKKFHPNLRADQEKKLKEALINLPKELEKLNQTRPAEVLHFIMNTIEMAFLSDETLPLALHRHREIARNYHEKWIDSIAYTGPSMSANDNLNLIALYIKNVLLNLIKISPTITLDSFDNNNLYELLKNIEKRQPLTQKDNHFYFIKNDLENNIFKKMNDSFLIKNYLFDEKNQHIDTQKLARLLKRIECFFTSPDNRSVLLTSITQACFSLIKNYCIHVIEKDTAPDMEYLHTIHSLLGSSLTAKLRQDKEMKEAIKNYINTYNGASNHLSDFIIHLLPMQEPCIYSYAEKRLAYIKSSMTASVDDYAFFSFFCAEPKIALLFSQYKEIMQHVLQNTANESKAWNQQSAYLIELFCDNDTVIAYRQKRIIEFLDMNYVAPEEANNLYSTFSRTLNHSRFLHKQINKNRILPRKNANLHKKISAAVNEKPWSLLLEHCVQQCANHNQIWKLHGKLIQYYLEKRLDCTQDWLGQNIQNIDEDQSKTEMDLFFFAFLGEKSIKKICEKIDPLIQELCLATKDICGQPLSQQRYQEIMNLLHCLKPFACLYGLYGENPTNKEAFANINEIEKKINLHYKLSTLIAPNLISQQTETSNIKLHNIALSLIQCINNLAFNQWEKDKNINQYLAYISNVTLSELENFIIQNQAQLDFQAFSTLTNLLLYLTADDLKQLLLNANKARLEYNPHWLKLINHINEGHVVRDIEEDMQSQSSYSFTEEFQQVLTFAKRLSNLKRLTHHMIKQKLVVEAGIHLEDEESKNISALLSERKIKGPLLIKLWSLCAAKLRKSALPLEAKPRYIFFLIKFLTHISDEILLQAKDNPALLNRFINLFPSVPDIHQDLKDSLNTTNESKHEKHLTILWPMVSDAERVSCLFLQIIDKTFALQLMQKVEKYILQKIPSTKLPYFKSVCNDARFNAVVDNVTLDPQEVSVSFGIKRNTDALKVIGMMKIYAKLSLIFQKGRPAQSTITLIDSLVKEAEQQTGLLNSRTYLALLYELRALAEKYFAKNDKSFLRELSNKRFSINLGLGL